MSHKNHSRRTVLKMAGGLATGLALVGAGTASADDGASTLDDIDTEGCECFYENKCDGYCVDDLLSEQYWQRECCECDGDKVCEDWYRVDCCLTSP